MMEIKPILSALSRTKVAVFLIILQIAITLAIITNAISIVGKNEDDINRPTGVDLDNSFVVQISSVDWDNDNAKAIMQTEIARMREIPGVTAVAATATVPLSGNNWCGGLNTASEGDEGLDAHMCLYRADENFADAFDFNIIEGRNFKPEEIVYQNMGEDKHVPYIMVSKSIAEQLFPDESAVGKNVYDRGSPSGEPKTIIGVFDQLIAGSPQRNNPYNMRIEGSLTWGHFTRYVVRTEPGQSARVMEEVEALLKEDVGRYVSQVRSFAEYKRLAYQTETGVITMLKLIVGLLTFINILGVVSLAWFNVNKRRKQIGTRRALGARKMDVIRYFLTENWLITSMGIVLGCGLALALNFALDEALEVGKMPLGILAVGSGLLWLIGLAAVYIPAMRAASISPATATRSV